MARSANRNSNGPILARLFSTAKKFAKDQNTLIEHSVSPLAFTYQHYN